jgi:hypothetical protein
VFYELRSLGRFTNSRGTGVIFGEPLRRISRFPFRHNANGLTGYASIDLDVLTDRLQRMVAIFESGDPDAIRPDHETIGARRTSIALRHKPSRTRRPAGKPMASS